MSLLLVTVMDAVTVHHHPGSDAGLYDQECPTLQLAVGAGSLGIGSQRLTDLGTAPPAPDALPTPRAAVAPSLAAAPTDTRAPPSST